MRTAATAILIVFVLGMNTLAEDFLIPLDDRPANRLFVEQMSRIGAPQDALQLPPRHLLGRLYDRGDSDAIIDWVDGRAQEGDTVFLSADMWLYGGLVASRTADVSSETVEIRLRRLQELGARGVIVHALATVPRLSLRTSDEQAPHESQLSKWAAKGDLPSAQDLLQKAREGAEVPFPSEVPHEVVMEYLGVRERNVSTIAQLIELSRDGYLDSLVLGQDDSNKTGLHHFEQQQLRDLIRDLEVGDKVTLLSGIDELTMSMVARVVAERAGISPTVRVVYSDPSAAEKIPPLESLPLETMVKQHLELSGARLVNDASADVDLHIYVPYSQPWKVPGEERRPDSEAFVESVLEAMQQGREVAVADLSLVNRMDPFLAESSLERLDLFELEGFASWNTPANTFGTVVAQVVCHQVAERSPEWTLAQRLESEKTHQAFMLARFIDDYAYQTVVREEVRGQAEGLSSRSEPLLNLFGPVGLDIRVRLVQWAERVFQERYLGRTFVLEPQGIEVEFRRSKLEVLLPWPRVFEVEARLDVRLGPVDQAKHR
jgi:Protein of unknown function (DUF4127)